MKYILLLLVVFNYTCLLSQVQEDRNICVINCKNAVHLENAKLIDGQMQNDTIMKMVEAADTLRFPIRFVIVKEDTISPDEKTKSKIEAVVHNLNTAFENAKFIFSIHQVAVLKSDLRIEDLSRNEDNLYVNFSEANDKKDILTLYILDHKRDFCEVTETSISCSRTGGFSYILSSLTNNIVISQFDLTDPKIVAHEFGHFFGLYHTFEERLFGKDKFGSDDCSEKGDRICDTPPDPGTVFEIYINYSSCEMIGLKDENGNEYKPIVENYMSYYKPCYLKEYKFSPQQEMRMKFAGQLDIRKKLSRN